jgi:hypothetical protein
LRDLRGGVRPGKISGGWGGAHRGDSLLFLPEQAGDSGAVRAGENPERRKAETREERFLTLRYSDLKSEVKVGGALSERNRIRPHH